MSHQAHPPQPDALNVDRGLESLQSSAEFPGPVEPLDEAHRHHCNDHIALIHESPEEQFAAVVPFVRQGLAADERCLYVVEDTSEKIVVSALRDGGVGVDVDAALESGQLSFHGVDETYLREGSFRPDEMLEFYADAIEEATEDYAGLRVSAETGWLLDETTSLADWMEYESRVNELFADEDCVALCQYDRTQIPAEAIRDLVQTHPHIVYDGTVCHNFYYTPPEEFLGPDQPDNEVERMVRTLVERTRALTELEEREDRLDALNGLNQSLMTAESVDEAIDCLIARGDSLGLPATCVGRYDPAVGALQCAGRTERGEETLARAAPFDGGEGVGWEAFLAGEPRRTTVDDPSDGQEVDGTEIVAVPLNDSGVLVTALPAATITDGDVDFVQTVAASVTTAMERAHREAELRAREETLAERNETLTRLDRINTTIRNIDQALVSASSREEIESLVCEQLTDAGPYTSAWIGKHDSLNDELTTKVQASAATGREDVAVGDTGQTTLAEQAAADRESQVVNDLVTHDGDDAWRHAALARGYHAAIALPLVYEDTTFGVLTVFADQPGVFDDLEEAVLGELADNIAHGINAVENKRSLVSNEVTELTFEVPVGEFVFGEMVRETDGCYGHEGVVSSCDDELRWFFSARGVAADAVLAYESRLPVSSLELLAEREDDGETVRLFEARHPYEGLPRDLLEHGGKLHDLRAVQDSVTVAVDVHTRTDVREFVEMFRTKYDGARLVAKRGRERPLQTVGEFRSVVTESLTPRQQEVLQTAYYSGYFEEPRPRTGGEIAASMDISQPTFTTHLRSAERKIYGELFEEAP